MKELTFATQELVQAIKKKILKGKCQDSTGLGPYNTEGVKPAQITKLLARLEVVLTTNEKASKSLLSASVTTKLEQLLSLSRTGYVDTELKCSNKSVKCMEHPSWFSILTKGTSKRFQERKNSLKTFWQLLTSLLQEITIIGAIKTITRARKVRLYFTKTQKEFFKRQISIQRAIYNQCVAYSRQEGAVIKLQNLRDLFVKQNENEFVMNESHFDLRDEAVRDFMKNMKSSWARFKNDGKPFKLAFRSRHDENYFASMSVLKKHWNKKNNYYSPVFKVSNIRTGKEKLKSELSTDCRLLYDHGKFYLCEPYNESFTFENVSERARTCFIDPGVKNFATVYDLEDQSMTTIAPFEQDRFTLRRKLAKLAKLESLRDKSTICRERKRLRKARRKMSERTKRLVTDLHYKAANYLTKRYDAIIIPKLNFHNLGNLNRKSKNILSTISHCQFVDRLKEVGEREGTIVLECSEEYTSKTCNNCGSYDDNLGNKNVYSCSHCNKHISRDFNGAVNICQLATQKIIKEYSL